MHLFLIPIGVMVTTQLLKLLIEGLKGNFNWENVNNYGGMPSTHSALIASLIFMLIYDQGSFAGPSVAIGMVLMVIVVRDAVGLRQQLSLHSRMINKLIKDLPDHKEYKYPVLHERLGHKPSEVAVGLLVGLILSYLASLFI